MKAENLIRDKNFMDSIMRRVPAMFFSNFSSDEIISEIHFAIVKGSKAFNPNKGRAINYIYSILINQLNKKISEAITIKQNEVSLDAAYNNTYMEDPDNHTELLAYFRTLPTEWLTELTQFVLGKKKKEEIAISNDPSFERVLDKIYKLVI